MKSAILITVRMKSTRLPKKALLEIRGKPVIEHLIDRLKLAKLPDWIVLCTSTHPDDAVLADVAHNNSIECFRGSELDVLDRLKSAAQQYNADLIVSTAGDNPFTDPQYVDKLMEYAK